MTYHITGLISTALYLLSVWGLWIQLTKIWDRKKLFPEGGATDIISTNLIAMAFLAFYLLFFYGFALERFNHYLVWPRLAAIILSLAILFEMALDRRKLNSILVFLLCTLATLIGVALLIFDREIAQSLQGLSQFLIAAIAVLLGQGHLHQIVRIWRSGDTGGIALRSHQLTFIKDMGTVAFGMTMGTAAGWPLVVLCGSNACFKLCIMWLFRWVRVSDVAQTRRLAVTP